MAFTFRGGVHPKGNKSFTRECPFEIAPQPEEVFLPLSQHIGKPAECIVSAGDRVLKGQMVAKAQEGLSVPVYSPVSGEVAGIVMRPTLFSTATPHIHIKNDKQEEEVRLPALENPTKEEIVERIREAGIVGMGGAGFPTAAKVAATVETLLMNVAECEPYITCDHRLLLEYPAEFLEGAELLRIACGADRIVIGVENNKPEVIEKLAEFHVPVIKKRTEINANAVCVLPLKTKYPQGGEKQMVYAVTGKEIPDGKLPSALGVMVMNAHTAFAVYEAVKCGKPLYERYMTLSGSAAQRPCNVLAKTGTPYSFFAELCGASEDTRMVISGGPMMGFCAVSGDVSTTKTTGSLLFFDKKEAVLDNVGACIGCGRCVSVCPMRLMPVMIDQYAFTGNLKEAERYGAMSCMECGCCSFACPAKRPLLQSIRAAKKKIRESK